MVLVFFSFSRSTRNHVVSWWTCWLECETSRYDREDCGGTQGRGTLLLSRMRRDINNWKNVISPVVSPVSTGLYLRAISDRRVPPPSTTANRLKSSVLGWKIHTPSARDVPKRAVVEKTVLCLTQVLSPQSTKAWAHSKYTQQQDVGEWSWPISAVRTTSKTQTNNWWMIKRKISLTLRAH